MKMFVECDSVTGRGCMQRKDMRRVQKGENIGECSTKSMCES